MDTQIINDSRDSYSTQVWGTRSQATARPKIKDKAKKGHEIGGVHLSPEHRLKPNKKMYSGGSFINEDG